MKASYSQEFKQSIVQKVTSPGGPSITEMSNKTGVHYTSIRSWIQNCATTPNMKKSKQWTPEAKLKAIAQTLSMSENELGEYLRANGLHSTELEEWKQDFYSSQKSAGRPRIDPELAELRSKEKELSKDLKRKDKALAEMSARIILLKKSRHLLWGEPEDDE
jgi:transposase-like protein